MSTEAVLRMRFTGGHHDRKEAETTDDESSSSSLSDESTSRGQIMVGTMQASNSDYNSSSKPTLSSVQYTILPWLGLAVWPLMLSLPLVLNHTSRYHYTTLFPRSWYSMHGAGDMAWLDNYTTTTVEEVGGIWIWGSNILYGSSNTMNTSKPLRHPLGLALGISAVVIGHVFLLLYFRLHQQQILGKTTSIQSRGAVQYDYLAALTNHLSQPGGFVLLGLYLAITWIFNMLPPSYYSFDGGILYTRVAMCLICQDLIQYIMHRTEHVAHPKIYRISHKPHHKFTNPKLFDAFDGSVFDTALMILLPLFVTAHVVRDCNVWTYMAFGSIYANWLTIIHSETTFCWERTFRKLGLGTAGDHHVHHKFFKYNFGHTFMWFDWVAGTYRNPKDVWGKEFNVGV